MEILLVIILFIILILVVTIKNDFSSQLNALQSKIDSLSTELKKLKIKEIRTESPDIKSEEKPVSISHQPSIAKFITTEKVPETIKAKVPDPEQTVEKFFKSLEPTPAPQPVKPPKPNFFERNPDLEKFIGENLANKIGIAILVLGIGFFVKYFIDKNWINEIGRVFIGIISGGALLGIAHRLRNKFIAFSSVLVGGGLAVLYLTISIGFHEYQLFTQTAAFILMIVITGFAVALSVAYNRLELIILSLLGGFASPFMVSTGEGNYIILFTYILILDGGMLVLAYYKKWNLVNILCYAFTIILFGSWLFVRFDEGNVSMVRGGIIFASLFYLVFFAMNIINNIKERTTFKSLEFSLLLSNTFLYYAVGMYILNNSFGEDLKGLFTVLLGAFNFIFAFSLFKNTNIDRNLIFLLIGLVLTFISLAAPVQLEGNYITLFWSAESVLLLWMSQKSGIRLMKLASVLLMGLMGISLIMDWDQIYIQEVYSDLTIIFNKGYITGLFVTTSILLTILLLKKEHIENFETVRIYKGLLIFGAISVLYVSQVFELWYQLQHYDFDFETSTVIIGCFNMLYILGLLIGEKNLKLDDNFKKAFAFWGIFAMLAYLVYYHKFIVATRNDFLIDGATKTGFVFHYILITLILIITILSLSKIRKLEDFNKTTFYAYAWFYVFFFVFLASAELDHIVLLAAGVDKDSIQYVLTQNHKIGYPILWGVSSFILITVGLKTKRRSLRIISLTLFLITLLKLFFVDIKGISEAGKIAAFISLGLLLLIVSFMYQRLKRLLLTEDTSEKSTENENS